MSEERNDQIDTILFMKFRNGSAFF